MLKSDSTYLILLHSWSFALDSSNSNEAAAAFSTALLVVHPRAPAGMMRSIWSMMDYRQVGIDDSRVYGRDVALLS